MKITNAGPGICNGSIHKQLQMTKQTLLAGLWLLLAKFEKATDEFREVKLVIFDRTFG